MWVLQPDGATASTPNNSMASLCNISGNQITNLSSFVACYYTRSDPGDHLWIYEGHLESKERFAIEIFIDNRKEKE